MLAPRPVSHRLRPRCCGAFVALERDARIRPPGEDAKGPGRLQCLPKKHQNRALCCLLLAFSLLPRLDSFPTQTPLPPLFQTINSSQAAPSRAGGAGVSVVRSKVLVTLNLVLISGWGRGEAGPWVPGGDLTGDPDCVLHVIKHRV